MTKIKKIVTTNGSSYEHRKNNVSNIVKLVGKTTLFRVYYSNGSFVDIHPD